MFELLGQYPNLTQCSDDIKNALNLMIETYKNKGKILVCGNGGSAADSEHIVGELMKGFMLKREVNDERLSPELCKGLQGALPAISLVSQSAILSAYINDVDPYMMYAQLVYGYGTEADLLICLSTSGNSRNVVNAAKVARALGIKVLSMTGQNRSALCDISDVVIRVPETETYKVQELHLPVYHYLCAGVEKYFFE